VQSDHFAVVGARVFSMSSLFMLALPLLSRPIPPSSLFGYFSLLLCSGSLIAGTFGMFYGIALVGAFRFSLLVKVEPIVTAIVAYLMLGEVLSPTQCLGMVLVLGSLVAYHVFEGRKQFT